MLGKLYTFKNFAAAVLVSAIISGTAFAQSNTVINKNGDVITISSSNTDSENFESAFLYKNDCSNAADIKAYDCVPLFTDGGAQHPDTVAVNADGEQDANIGFVFDKVINTDKFIVSYDLKPMQSDVQIKMGLNAWYANCGVEELSASGVYFGSNGKMGYAPQGSYHTGNTQSELTYKAGSWYHFDTVYDLSARTAAYYVDGDAWGQTGIYKTVLTMGVKSVVMSLAGSSAGTKILIDNVRVVPFEDLKVCYRVTGSCITAEFSQPMNFENFPSIKIENITSGETVSVSKTEQTDPYTLDIYCSDVFGAKAKTQYKLTYSFQPESLFGNVLLETDKCFTALRTAAQIYAPGKKPSDLASAKNKTEVLTWQGQTLTGLDGSYTFSAQLPQKEGEYTAYISDENSAAPTEYKFYNRVELPALSSDFENYTGGKPSEWTFIYGGSANLTAAENGSGKALKIDNCSSEMRLFKNLGISVPTGIYRVALDAQVDSSANVMLKLMNTYQTSLNADNVFELMRFGSDGFMGYYLNQDTDAYFSANSFKFIRKVYYSLEIWLDFDLRRITYALNGKVLGRAEMNGSLASIGGIAFVSEKGSNGDTVCLDNVLVESVPYEYAAYLYSLGKCAVKELGEETALSLGTDKTGNIFPAEEPRFSVELFERGNGGEKTLYTSVEENETVLWEKETKVTLVPGKNTVEISAPVNRYGIFTFAARVGNTEEKLSFSVANASENAKANKLSGINEHTSPEYADAEKTAQLDCQAGFGIIRSGLEWRYFRQSDGSYCVPDWYRSFSDTVRKNGVERIMTLGYNCPELGISGEPKTDSQLEAFAEYAENIAREFGEDGVYYEIWNEYPLDTEGNIDNYIKMMSYIYPAVKRGNANVKVVGVAAAHTDYSGIESVITRGGKKYMDILSIHQYCDANSPEKGDMLGTAVENVRAVMDKNGMESCELWMTEYGWTASNVTEQQQAAYLVRTAAMNCGKAIVNRLICYNGVKKQMYQKSAEKEYEYNYGIIHSPNETTPYAATPAYLAFSNFNALTADAVFRESSQSGGTDKYSFKTADGSIDMLWSDEGESVYAVPDGAQALDMYGNVIADTGSVTVGSNPVYIVKKSVSAEIMRGNEIIENASLLQEGDVISLNIEVGEEAFTETGMLDLYAVEYNGGQIAGIKSARVEKNSANVSIPLTYSGGEIQLFVWEHGTFVPTVLPCEILK